MSRTRAFALLSVISLAAIASREPRAFSAPIAPAPASTGPAVGGVVWLDKGDVPLPDWANSVEILREDEALSVSPGGTRRGLVAAGVRLPILGATRGPGCLSRWVLVGPLAYVCSDKVKLVEGPPGVDGTIHPVPADGLPYHYYFVGKDGGDAYAKLSHVDDETPDEQLERGWSVAGVNEVTYKGASYVVTRKGRFIARNQLGAVAAYGFHGETLDLAVGAPITTGWILPDKATVLAEAKTNAKKVGQRTRLQVISIAETAKVGKEVWLRIGTGEWVKSLDARVPTLAPPPTEVGPAERWIDVDTATQTLVAYEGPKPVFATLISSGKPSTPTPKGVFRIWVKLRSATMSNADSAQTTTDDGAPFSIEDVPWVQYFSNGVALHGAFWHRKFGYTHSHGCVNVAPLDGMRLFDWTLSRLPRGWDAVFPTSAEPATVIRVR